MAKTKKAKTEKAVITKTVKPETVKTEIPPRAEGLSIGAIKLYDRVDRISELIVKVETEARERTGKISDTEFAIAELETAINTAKNTKQEPEPGDVAKVASLKQRLTIHNLKLKEYAVKYEKYAAQLVTVTANIEKYYAKAEAKKEAGKAAAIKKAEVEAAKLQRIEDSKWRNYDVIEALAINIHYAAKSYGLVFDASFAKEDTKKPDAEAMYWAIGTMSGSGDGQVFDIDKSGVVECTLEGTLTLARLLWGLVDLKLPIAEPIEKITKSKGEKRN